MRSSSPGGQCIPADAPSGIGSWLPPPGGRPPFPPPPPLLPPPPADPLQPLHRDVPAGDRRHHPGVGLAQEEAEAALGGEAADDQGVVDGGEALAPHAELRPPPRAPA